jgi:hypothetical protein
MPSLPRTFAAAAEAGLDFITVTDHDTGVHFSGLRVLQPYFDTRRSQIMMDERRAVLNGSGEAVIASSPPGAASVRGRCRALASNSPVAECDQPPGLLARGPFVALREHVVRPYVRPLMRLSLPC